MLMNINMYNTNYTTYVSNIPNRYRSLDACKWRLGCYTCIVVRISIVQANQIQNKQILFDYDNI